MPKPPSLTLILAATPSLGIGKGNTLPWPQLKKEMGYFARVTKRVPSPLSAADGPRKVNAVLMGRKTWDSIPAKFRPLKDRLNIVITRNAEEFEKTLASKSEVEGPLVATGILDALSKLESKPEVDRVFVIGGASIYQTALELPQTKRVLLTNIRTEYDCDTFFPVNLEESVVWRKASREELEAFTGEKVDDGGVEEQGVRFEFCLFERQ
ncbi:dihydrofolate reductase-like domain-containing protein [Paraphoma chrysanthemicola]|uniref:Dihydrofolate reductase n=1 Tax=Paraphoma chrysanthemicola TaxID=798071 RepID=A0A8K0QXK9_9PLEO|nr:dihydrofolate reductase-like domain-containing protein [Paraphoma chrysanthemicola]